MLGPKRATDDLRRLSVAKQDATAYRPYVRSGAAFEDLPEIAKRVFIDPVVRAGGNLMTDVRSRLPGAGRETTHAFTPDDFGLIADVANPIPAELFLLGGVGAAVGKRAMDVVESTIDNVKLSRGPLTSRVEKLVGGRAGLLGYDPATGVTHARANAEKAYDMFLRRLNNIDVTVRPRGAPADMLPPTLSQETRNRMAEVWNNPAGSTRAKAMYYSESGAPSRAGIILQDDFLDQHITHELGHAMDNHGMSQSPEYAGVVRDVMNSTSGGGLARKPDTYSTQPHEIFAELFSMRNSMSPDALYRAFTPDEIHEELVRRAMSDRTIVPQSSMLASMVRPLASPSEAKALIGARGHQLYKDTVADMMGPDPKGVDPIGYPILPVPSWDRGRNEALKNLARLMNTLPAAGGAGLLGTRIVGNERQ